MSKHKKAGRIPTYNAQQIKEVFDAVYFRLTDAGDTGEVMVSGSRLEFDDKHFTFAVYGSLDGRLVCQSLHGSVDVLNVDALASSVEHGFWQFGFVSPESLLSKFDKR
jgi:hypothetical protein